MIRNRAILDAVRDAIFLADTDTGMIVDANPAAEALCGWNLAELQSMHHTQLHPPELAEAIRSNFNHRARVPGVGETLVLHRDGHRIPVEVNSSHFTSPERRHILIGVFRDLTARNAARDVLLQSEERLRLAIKATNDAIWDCDLKRGTVSWNETYSTLYGRPAETSDSWLWWIDRIHPEDRERTVAGLRTAISSGASSWICEYRFQRADGQWADIHDRAYIARDESGEAWRVIGAMQDFTARRQAEAVLRESEERFRRAIKATNDAVWDIDLKSGAVTWNDTYSTIYGSPKTEDSWQSWIARIHPEDRVRIVDGLHAALEGGASSWSAEYRLRRADGEWTYTYDRAYIARDASGVATRMIGAMLDLTNQKRAEAALRESEERFRRVFEEGPLGIALVGKDYRFQQVNSALCQMVGYSEAEFVLKTFSEITHPDDVQADAALAQRLFKGEIPFYRIQKRYLKKTGEIIWINLTASILLAADGEPLYGLAMVEDITEIKRSQEEALFRQKLESLGALAGGIAHDFNNLLGIIQAQADLALMELDASAPGRQELRAIRSVATRGSEIVRQLMIYAGAESKAEEQIDLSKIVDEMLALLKVSVTKRAVIKTDLAQDLAATVASAAQLRQIVMNLITNASDAIGDRDGVIHVITRSVVPTNESAAVSSGTLTDARYVELEVSDTGRGMSPETQAKIFDPFFTTKAAGRGLGLAVVQGIVRSLGGAIRITSDPDRGTTFRILLPSMEPKAPATGRGLAGVEEPLVPNQRRAILVVDDEDHLRQAVVKMLRKSGFEVWEAADGASAIALLRVNGHKMDAILLDMTIPGASSHEVVAEAAHIQPEIRIILTSAYSRQMIDSSMNVPQIRSFIRKPFQFSDLLKALRQSLSSSAE